METSEKTVTEKTLLGMYHPTTRGRVVYTRNSDFTGEEREILSRAGDACASFGDMRQAAEITARVKARVMAEGKKGVAIQ